MASILRSISRYVFLAAQSCTHCVYYCEMIVHSCHLLQRNFHLIEFALLQLLCGLLNWACMSSVAVTGVDRLLAAEVEWLKNVRASVSQMALGGPEPPVDETLLEGHLCVTRELVAFLPPEKKYEIGGDSSKAIFLIRVCRKLCLYWDKMIVQQAAVLINVNSLWDNFVLLLNYKYMFCSLRGGGN